MTTTDIDQLVQNNLPGGLARLSGSILYSGIDTLRPGRFYLMGLNPGGTPRDGDSKIGDPIYDSERWSAYTQSCWVPGCSDPLPCRHIGADGRVSRDHLSLHQCNIRDLCGWLATEPDCVMATNAIFARSRDDASIKGLCTGMGDWDWWEKCWPVHQAFLAEVRPSWIITLGKGWGTSAFAFLMKEAGVRRADVTLLGADGATDGRWFEGSLPMADGSKLVAKVLGTPHPSYPFFGADLRSFIEANVR